MITEPRFDSQVPVDGTSDPGLKAVDPEPAIGAKGGYTGDADTAIGRIDLCESDDLRTVIHSPMMRPNNRVVKDWLRSMKTLAERIDERLAEVGLTANAASVLSGASRDLIRNIKRNPTRVPNGRTLVRLSHVLQVPPEFFSDGFAGQLPEPQALPPQDIPERYLTAARALMQLSEDDQASLIREIEHLAEAARARRERGG